MRPVNRQRSIHPADLLKMREADRIEEDISTQFPA